MWTMLALAASSASAQGPPAPLVEAEEPIYEYTPANNGAGPLWCYGATCIVRRGNDVFASGQETLKDIPPLNNTRWTLYRRADKGWELVQADDKGRQREPCPLGVFADGRLLLSTNPSLAPDARSGPANPHVLQFALPDLKAKGAALQPVWAGNPAFTEHSYRGMGVDGPNGELVLLNNLGYEETYWAFLDKEGRWSRSGIFRFPVRACYPETALVNRACHVLTVGDIVEPVEAWRKWKLEKSGGRRWDYVFRRLFYVWTPDIATTPFAPVLEVENVDATAGHILNLDIWVDRDGAAHLLYRKITVQNAALRDEFLRGAPIVHTLEHCVVKDNKVIARHTLMRGGESGGPELPGYARLHATEDGRLFAFCHVGGTDAGGRKVNENRVIEILPGGRHSPPATVGLKRPFTAFMTATERGGSAPSRILDILGSSGGKPETSYARVRLY